MGPTVKEQQKEKAESLLSTWKPGYHIEGGLEK